MSNKHFFKFKRTYGEYGYFAYVDSEGNFTVDHEAPREGGTVYCGNYPGKDSYIMKKILKDDKILYDSIVSYYKNNVVDKVEINDEKSITLSDWIAANGRFLALKSLFLRMVNKEGIVEFELRLNLEAACLYFGDCLIERIFNDDNFCIRIYKPEHKN